VFSLRLVTVSAWAARADLDLAPAVPVDLAVNLAVVDEAVPAAISRVAAVAAVIVAVLVVAALVVLAADSADPGVDLAAVAVAVDLAVRVDAVVPADALPTA